MHNGSTRGLRAKLLKPPLIYLHQVPPTIMDYLEHCRINLINFRIFEPIRCGTLRTYLQVVLFQMLPLDNLEFRWIYLYHIVNLEAIH